MEQVTLCVCTGGRLHAYEPGEACPPDALERGVLRDPESPSRPPLPCGARRAPGEPDGYIAWHAWAKQMGKTHRQEMCPDPRCRLFHIWTPRHAAVS